MAIGPYLSVEQCQQDVEDANCGHVHQYGRGQPAPGFKVKLGYTFINDPEQNAVALAWFRDHAPGRGSSHRTVVA